LGIKGLKSYLMGILHATGKGPLSDQATTLVTFKDIVKASQEEFKNQEKIMVDTKTALTMPNFVRMTYKNNKEAKRRAIVIALLTCNYLKGS
jgi:hypothetical protein